MENEVENVSTTSSLPEQRKRLAETKWFQILLCTLYSFIFIFGLVGNATVCYIINRLKKLRTVTNLFILNLASSDFIFSASIPLEFPIFLGDYKWPYISFFCKLYTPLQTVAVSVSIFTLATVSMIRYKAIIHPLKRQVSHTTAKHLVFGIWALSILLMVPHFLTLKVKEGTCAEEWPQLFCRKIYTTLLFVCFYVVPLTTVVFTYTKIVRELKRKKEYLNIALKDARDEETSKVVRMLIRVTLLFACCNLPSQIMWLWLDFGNADKVFPYFWDVLTAMNILIFANSVVNPLLYYTLHDKFRNEVRSVLRGCWKARRKNIYKGIKLSTKVKHQKVYGEARKRESQLNMTLPYNKRQVDGTAV